MDRSTDPDIDDKLRFLFGTVAAQARVHDPDSWPRLMLDDRPEQGISVTAIMLRIGVAFRLLANDPTGTWATAQRMLADGTDRHAVMDAIIAEVAPVVDQAYEIVVAIAVERVVLPVDELVEAMFARLALDPADPLADAVVRNAVELHLYDPGSPLGVIPSGDVVHIPALMADCVLTHPLSVAERDGAHLDVDPDLAAVGQIDQLRTAAGPLEVAVGAAGDLRWIGPAGWLPDVGTDALLTVRLTDPETVEVGSTDGAVASSAQLVAALRAAYDAQRADPPLPLTGADLVWGVLARDRVAFAQPRPPLAELAAEAGLERRGLEFGHGADAWVAAAKVDRTERLTATLSDEQVRSAEAALDVLEAGPVAPAGLRSVLELIDDADVLMAVAAELLIPDEPERLSEAAAFADRLVGAAGSSPRATVAHTLAALVAERCGRVAEAESHLRAAAASGEWAVVEERLGWYASDRGRAAEALAHLRTAGFADDEPDAEVLLAFVAGPTGPATGRNQPCWCGSGRKTKQCHRDVPPLPPLAERFDWLQQKAVAYLDRRGGGIDDAVTDLAVLLAGDDGDPGEVLDDPLLADVVLHEGGWFAMFVAERGVLLPADEAALAAEWAAIRRSVHEVVGIGYGRGVTLRNLSGGSEVEVGDKAVAGAVSAGELLCARVLPDGGGGHRFAGVVTAVPRGREDELREVLDDGDPFVVLDWLAEAEHLD